MLLSTKQLRNSGRSNKSLKTVISKKKDISLKEKNKDKTCECGCCIGPPIILPCPTGNAFSYQLANNEVRCFFGMKDKDEEGQIKLVSACGLILMA